MLGMPGQLASARCSGPSTLPRETLLLAPQAPTSRDRGRQELSRVGLGPLQGFYWDSPGILGFSWDFPGFSSVELLGPPRDHSSS